ncbi:MAG: GIY-YIG nuclease family protein [Lachnospiraceae bacterium]|nr:GIY-YIG nuclease family protein [Lachnospiraceae bacterium]
MSNYVYILSCVDGTFYTGWTTHLEERVKTHNQGKGAKYTRSRLPVKLLYWEEYSDKGEALRREAAIKKMSRKQKEELVGRNV